jgi:glycosyltransferase involved in cell wall biosynthesis
VADAHRPRVLLACGYFDWFSGYQEVGLARALARLVDTHVLAGNRVNPLFSDAHLKRVGVEREYQAGHTRAHDVSVTRLRVRETRSMLWSSEAKSHVADGGYDLVLQIMPGQGLPAAASLAGRDIQRSVLYGDNVAMYAGLGSLPARLKYLAFAASKGSLYRWVNGRANHVYGYTPNTVERLAAFTGPQGLRLLPLAFDSSVFGHDDDLRKDWRHEHGYADTDVVVLAAGKIQPQKRIDALARAVEGLRGNHPELRFHVIGADDSAASDAVRAVADDRWATVEGFVHPAALNRAFNGADIGVWPVMPAITIQQAMGTGLPVLLPRNDLVSHLIAHPEAGLTYRVGEPLEEALTMSLSELLADVKNPNSKDTVRRRISRAAQNAWLSTPATSRRLLADAGISVPASSGDPT